MPPRRIIAYALHEHELGAVHNALKTGLGTESFVIGEADDAVIAELRSHGIIVQELGAEPPPLESGASGVRTFAPGETRRPRTAPKPGQSRIYRLALKGPLLDEWRREIERAGCEILEALPNFALRVRVDPAKVAGLAALSMLERPPEALDTVAATLPTFDAGALAPAGAVAAIAAFDILLVNDAARDPLVAWLQERNVPIAAARGRKVRIYALPDSALLDDITGLTDWVERVEVFVAPKLFNDIARQLLGIDADPAAAPPAAAWPWDGDGQIVAVADTGIDESHPDFQGRITGAVGRGRPGDASDPDGHGTHVAGSVLGDGSASQGAIRGTAPGAQLFFQSLLDKEGELGGLPFELGELFEEGYAAGARIHNNSWGAATSSSYRITSNEVDEFVRRRPDMLVVIAAGNEGTALRPRNSKEGFVDWLTIGSPATCKNALTVGASRSSRAVGAYAPHTYGEIWGDDYPAAPIAEAPVSGDPQGIGAFSSRGPCDEYRIKPDVVAPGTDILSTRSSRAPLRNFWGPAKDNNPKYAFMGGTSMATPLVSGCAAQVRQYYVSKRTHEPSAALLKATLINGTRRLTGADAVADYPDLPNYHQGFGAVYLPGTLPDEAGSNFRLEFFDNWQDPATHFKATGQRLRFRFDVAAGGALRVCMAYTDVPGRGVQNNLNLFLELPGAANKLFGNEKVPRGFNGPDPNNNVEIIRIDDAAPGQYMVAIVASTILRPPQDVALIVTGRLTSDLRKV